MWGGYSCPPAGEKDRPKPAVLERCVFKYRNAEVHLLADAYRGDEIRQAILDIFDAAAGASPETVALSAGSQSFTLKVRGGSDLVAYVGHDGLMDFRLPVVPKRKTKLTASRSF